MLDNLTQSADGVLVGLFVVSLVVFFLFGPHKVYESIFGSLFGLGMYLLIHEMTFVSPDTTRTLLFGQWIVDNRGTLLWFAKGATVILFFVSPVTIGINVSGVVRGTLVFFIKLIFLSAFCVCFMVVLFSFLYGWESLFWQVALLPGSPAWNPFLQTSFLYTHIRSYSHVIIFLAFIASFYKILFSHWVSSLMLAFWAVYVKWNEVFGKRNLDTISSGHHDAAESETGHDIHIDEHHAHH